MLKLQFDSKNRNLPLSDAAVQAKQTYLGRKDQFGYAQLPYLSEQLLAEIEDAKKYAAGMETFVLIGIGGSDLGARAIVNALLSQYQKQIYFCGDTTDPKSLLDLSAELDLSKTLFLVISKSGNTIEQGTSFLYFRELITTQLGKDAVTKHIMFLTDPETGTLRKLAREQGYPTMNIPSNVGGRYSVLSSVGMLPASLIGTDVSKFLAGAKDMSELINSSDSESDPALKYADWQYRDAKVGKNITVFMPYEYGLTEFARWFKQLWAESLGKKHNLQGEVVNNGTTPVQAIGPVDQHSQLQLFNEGPDDKNFTMLVATNAQRDINVPADLADLPDFEFLAGKSMHEILNGEFATTLYALQKNGRSTCTIEVPVVDEYYLGMLFYFFEQAVVYLGAMYNIDPFDQPGVEMSKNAMYGILGKEGYEKDKAEFEAFSAQ